MDAEQGISGHAHMVCLLGNPTGHSLSPAIHNLSFELLGINATYLCFDVDNADLGNIVAAFKAMEGWDGLNVTMPCKQAIIEHLYSLDEAAGLIGAVNVVSKSDDGHAIGHNTDGLGFMVSLAEGGVHAEGARMVLLGPGGAGSAILAQAALDGVAHIDVFGRAEGKSFLPAQELIERVVAQTDCGVELHDLSNTDELASCIQAADILVNATSVGMGEGCTDTPVPQSLLKPGMAVADIVYHPRETQLLRDAKALGCTTVPGLGMLLAQAAASEAIWYGAEMPADEIASRLFN
ncbi:MAG: shikimate dehydrogenase [Eggerthellaceae bacterium]|nr:shikimate dehydrogenase [Eggerthellaceae bacterium]